MVEDQDNRISQLIQDNAAVNDLLKKQAEAGLTNLHRPIEQLGALIARPQFIIGNISVFTGWIVINLVLKFTYHHTWDEPPFYWLQGLITFLALVVTSIVLVAQARQGQIAEQRNQLQLQFAVLNEQRSAKIIGLLEELRSDLPNVRDRIDEDAEVLGQPTKPEAILQAMETLADVGETALPPKEKN
ncbi:DUF1003 domain-containing protein [Deinococcus radiomollis]|uniref:DUF1003 domain-containing protein n=1 Tax=Deinococcus radiomollis TaxID=468916 RepID=UPI0038918822